MNCDQPSVLIRRGIGPERSNGIAQEPIGLFQCSRCAGGRNVLRHSREAGHIEGIGCPINVTDE